MSTLDPHVAGAGPRGPGPVVLVLPMLALALGILWARHGRSPNGGPRPDPPAPEREGAVAGWVGEALPAPGARLEARLVPLHGDPVRQSFDRDVLAGRLGLAAGRPWQLELRYTAPDGVVAPALPLPAARLCDAAGACLVPAVPSVPAPSEGECADPLLTLLAPPPALAPGERVTVVLWGEPPGEGARLVLDSIEVPLRPSKVPQEALPRTLARLEPGGER